MFRGRELNFTPCPRVPLVESIDQDGERIGSHDGCQFAFQH
jgi:hypothetical protein